MKVLEFELDIGRSSDDYVSKDFCLEKVVCNHGFFMMAPNRWIPSEKCLIRPLHLNSSNKNVTVYITQSTISKNFIFVTVLHSNEHQFSDDDKEEIQGMVSRMLRISERDDRMVKEFHIRCPEAKETGSAQIFRSPTLFEDIVKTILLCHCSWARSLKMAEALCKLGGNGNGSKRKRLSSSSSSCCWRIQYQYCMGNFPSPQQIAGLHEKKLDDNCKLGYRASIILELARTILNGSFDVDGLQHLDHDKLRPILMRKKGFGPFVVANIMMCLGFYQHIPVDTETIKHLEQVVHGKTGITTTIHGRVVISEIYDKYAPFQCLVYWMERVKYYETKLGKLSDLPHWKYPNATTTNFKTCTSGEDS
ncbi:DNA glycosylase [Striga asiatica]|uniref:DNA glycosylase n=1 Tax=Striga asiatica TaxID=4170 RepID=A0A5A7PED5_STRAF|nr:DNA glycosylase [Striga asiatica]